MPKIFKRRKVKRQPENPHIEKMATVFAKAIIHIQSRIANCLSKQEQKLSISQKKWFLFLFIGGMSIVTGSIFYKGMSGHQKDSSIWFRHQSINVPKTQPLPDSADFNYLLQKLDSLEKLKTKISDSIHQ